MEIPPTPIIVSVSRINRVRTVLLRSKAFRDLLARPFTAMEHRALIRIAGVPEMSALEFRTLCVLNWKYPHKPCYWKCIDVLDRADEVFQNPWPITPEILSQVVVQNSPIKAPLRSLPVMKTLTEVLEEHHDRLLAEKAAVIEDIEDKRSNLSRLNEELAQVEACLQTARTEPVLNEELEEDDGVKPGQEPHENGPPVQVLPAALKKVLSVKPAATKEAMREVVLAALRVACERERGGLTTTSLGEAVAEACTVDDAICPHEKRKRTLEWKCRLRELLKRMAERGDGIRRVPGLGIWMYAPPTN